MRLLLQLICVAGLSVFVPMGICNSLYLAFDKVPTLCGHNGGYQILLIFVIGLGFVVVDFWKRADKKREAKESQD